MRTTTISARIQAECQLPLPLHLSLATEIHKAFVDQPDPIDALAELLRILVQHPAFTRHRHDDYQDRALRTKEAIAIAGFGKSHFYAIQNKKSPSFDETFPEAFYVGRSPRWWESSVRAWLQAQAAAPNSKRQGAGS